MAPKLFKIVSTQKVDIQITLTNGSATYTTGDVVEGIAKITPKVDTRFDKIDIEFIGTVRTYNDCNVVAAAGHGRPVAFHQFLKLVQPGLQGYYPTDSILRAGRTCHIPFQFVVPEHLLPHVCNHNSQGHGASEGHLLLPPSLGEDSDADLMAIPDDMAPCMTRIRYETIVRVVETDNVSNKICEIASKAKIVRVVPTVGEEPLEASTQTGDYVLQQEKVVKKKFSKSKYGTLVIDAVQPQPVLLTTDPRTEAEQTTTVNIALRFDPANDGCSPPPLRNVVSELRATTHFTTNVRTALPTHNMRATDPYQGSYHENVKLTSRNTASEEWTKKGASYITSLPVQVTLPTKKTFVPTFHSCLVSRVYTLMLTINMNTPGSQTSLQLKLPFHITADRMVYHYSGQDSDYWAGVEISDEKLAILDLPPHYLDIGGLAKCLPSVSVVPC